MSGHEFEKQVRQKLNDLKMTPSAQAWESIEEKLHERKRRPVAFYWLPLLLIGLAAGGYLLLNNEPKIALPDNNSIRNVKVQPKADDAVSPEQQNDHPESLSPGDISSIDEKDQPYVRNNNPVLVTPGNEGASGVKNVPQIKINSAAGVASENNTQDPEEQNNLVSVSPGKDAPGISVKNFPQENQQNTPQRKKLSLKISDFPTGPVTSASTNSFNSNIIPVQHANKKSLVNKINKWSYGLSGFAGVTAVNEGNILNYNNAQVEDVSAVPDFAPRQPYKPSSISPGFSFSAGAFVRRELSTRFSLSVGINYLQLNTHNKVGSEVNGSQIVNNGTRGYILVANYFTVEQDKPSEYRNRYHFIELPVELHTKLNKSKKLPIHLNTGVAVSQLINSNSLHFDGTAGIYYRNDKLLNLTQVAARTGIAVGVLNKTTRPLWIGPSARYNISKILQKDVAGRKNFMSFGIDVKMFIK